MESETFSDSSLHHICESENFGLPFSTKKSVAWEVKCEKLTSENLRELFRDKLRKLRLNQGHPTEISSKFVENTF